MEKLKLFLDDERPAPQGDWAIVRSYDQAVEWIKENGCPRLISFDHDLGGEQTGLDFAKYLVEKDLDTQGRFIPSTFAFKVHSANIIGGENIELFFRSYLKLKAHGELP